MAEERAHISQGEIIIWIDFTIPVRELFEVGYKITFNCIFDDVCRTIIK
jgi:hypothetical protein